LTSIASDPSTLRAACCAPIALMLSLGTASPLTPADHAPIAVTRVALVAPVELDVEVIAQLACRGRKPKRQQARGD
jgi:hypothetical protein